MQTLGSLVYYNLFGRFPNVRVVSIENGSDWVDYLLHHLDKKKGMGRQGPWPGGYFRRPAERDPQRAPVSHAVSRGRRAPLVELIGADHVLFGSDYPHPEGLAEPNTFVDLLDGLDQQAVRRIMVDNCLELLGAAA